MANPRFMYSNHEIARRNHAIGIEVSSFDLFDLEAPLIRLQEVRDLVLHLIADGPTPNWLRVENGNLIQRVVVLMVPGLTNDLLAIQPIPTSATTNPNLPLSIPLPNPLLSVGTSAAAIPFIATTFSHACPTRAPGDQNRMHSVLSSFFSCPVSAEERKRRMKVKCVYASRSPCIPVVNGALAAEKSKSDPTQYLLTIEQMIENDYPIPSYMADVFQKPEGWVETPEQHPPANPSVRRPIYAIDCEMVGVHIFFSSPYPNKTHSVSRKTAKNSRESA
jgi:RNA exonuclease 1